MGDFYLKNSKGEYIPIQFEQICTRDWSGKLILVKIGNGDVVPEDEIEETTEAINSSDALRYLENTSFLITLYNLDFSVFSDIKDIGKQYVSVRVAENDDLSKLGPLMKEAKNKLRNTAKKVVIMPTPLTIEEYKEIMEIKRRCDTRRNRRGH